MSKCLILAGLRAPGPYTPSNFPPTPHTKSTWDHQLEEETTSSGDDTNKDKRALQGARTKPTQNNHQFDIRESLNSIPSITLKQESYEEKNTGSQWNLHSSLGPTSINVNTISSGGHLDPQIKNRSPTTPLAWPSVSTAPLFGSGKLNQSLIKLSSTTPLPWPSKIISHHLAVGTSTTKQI